MFSSSGFRRYVFLILLFFVGSNLAAGVIQVPADFSTIQEAIDSAQVGDEIVIAPGTYVENLYIPGKDIVIRSSDPLDAFVVKVTIIDGNQAGSVITFAGTETEDCVLSGLTITNGRKVDDGGGIDGQGTRATIEHNVISDNTVLGNGAGLSQCHGTIQNNQILRNRTLEGVGGGLYNCDGRIQFNQVSENREISLVDCDGLIQHNTIRGDLYSSGLAGCNGTIQNNVISGNFFDGISDCAATIQRNIIMSNELYGITRCEGTINSNLIARNGASGLDGCSGNIYNNIVVQNQGYGIEGCEGIIVNNTVMDNKAIGLWRSVGDIANNIIWGNNHGGEQVSDIFLAPNYCCIQNYTGGGTGNIAGDPLIVGGTDYRLTQDSPCIDAGALVPSLTEELGQFVDFAGYVRPFNGSVESRGDGSDIDIGAYEFYSVLLRVAGEPEAGSCPLAVRFVGSATATQGALTAYRWLVDDMEVVSQFLVVSSTLLNSAMKYTFTDFGSHETRFGVQDDKQRWNYASQAIQVWTLTPTPVATSTPTLVPTPSPTATFIPTRTPIASDINRDGYVDERDLLLMHQEWHHGEPPK